VVLTAVTGAFAHADAPAPIAVATVTPAEDALLARWHDIADPAADAAVEDLYADNKVDAVNTALKSWNRERPEPAGRACLPSCTISSPRT